MAENTSNHPDPLSLASTECLIFQLSMQLPRIKNTFPISLEATCGHMTEFWSKADKQTYMCNLQEGSQRKELFLPLSCWLNCPDIG